ncbi:unnamed protein product, partial [Brassica oleracea var. botrytis]
FQKCGILTFLKAPPYYLLSSKQHPWIPLFHNCVLSPTQITACDKQKVDELVSQLVTANLERDMAQDELLRGEKKFREASKMIELLKKLKEVDVEENKDLATEANSDMELQELIIY